MFRRLLPVFVALGFGLLALGWGLVTLQRMFAEETEQARDSLRERQAEINRKATEQVRELLRKPYAAPDYIVVANGLQTKPSLARPKPTMTRALIEAYEQRRPVASPTFVNRLVVFENEPELADSLGRLQELLAHEVAQFSQAELEFFSQRLAEHAKERGVPTSTLDELRAGLELGNPILPKVKTPMIFAQSWYLGIGFSGEQIGREIDFEKVLHEAAGVLRATGVVGVDDRLAAQVARLQPLSTLMVTVDMPELHRAAAEISRRYSLKNSMIVVCGLLAIALTVFGLLAQSRKQRFLDLKSDFVATVSHELRTPLASIRLLAETLERSNNQTFDETIKHFPSRIVKVADGLHFLVENILSFNQVTKGRWVAELKPLRLDEVINDLRADLTEASSKPVHLALTAPDDLQITADPALARLLFANLGRNACAYNERASVELTVKAAKTPGGDVVIRFTDNGIGIPGDEWENVFHDFYRLKPTGAEVHGSGLGLALCKRIMAIHRGTLVIEASGPKGTTFAMAFPSPAF